MFDQCECKLIDTNMNLANSFSKKKIYSIFSKYICSGYLRNIFSLVIKERNTTNEKKVLK